MSEVILAGPIRFEQCVYWALPVSSRRGFSINLNANQTNKIKLNKRIMISKKKKKNPSYYKRLYVIYHLLSNICSRVAL